MIPISVPADDGVVIHVEQTGDGDAVLVLSGGPGCVHYLADPALAPRGVRALYPDPRGVGRSGGGPHDMTRAVADLEGVRRHLGLDRWVVLGHSWGSDLAVRYALEHPQVVRAVVGIAGHGLHRDRQWSQVYEAGTVTGPPAPEIAWVPAVHRALMDSFMDWIHSPTLWRDLADSPVPMRFVAAGDDIRPDWPLRQLAELVPQASFEVLDGVPHDLWHSHPERWVALVTAACHRPAA